MPSGANEGRADATSVGPALSALATDITTHIGYVDVVPGGWGSPLPYSCARIVAEQESGGDPTTWWREAVRVAQKRRYGQVAPPTVGAAFVMGWYLQVVAVPVAFAAVLTDWLPDVSPEALAFDLDETDHYPVAESLGGESV